MAERIIDCHAHIIDHARFPFGPGATSRAQADRDTPRPTPRCWTGSAPRTRFVQPSGYGVDNRAMLDAMRAATGRYRAIAVVNQGASERELDEPLDWKRFNGVDCLFCLSLRKKRLSN